MSRRLLSVKQISSEDWIFQSSSTPNGTPCPAEQFWANNSALNHAATWGNAWQAEPPVTPDFAGTTRLNNVFAYSHMAVKNEVDSDKLSSLPSEPGNVFPKVSSGMSGPPSNISPPHKSSHGDFLDPGPSLLSPGITFEQTTPDDRWSHCYRSSPDAKALSPQHSPSTFALATHIAQDSTIFSYSALSNLNSAFPPYTALSEKGSYSSDLSTLSSVGTQTSFSGSSWSHKSASSLAPWRFSDHPLHHSRLPTMPLLSPEIDPVREMQRRLTSWSSPDYSAVPDEEVRKDHIEKHDCCAFQISQRKINDEILVKGKENGLTYKQILEHIVGDKPAESTLRGRYRSLTKAKKDRVRRPIWSKRDIKLLNQFVEQEFKRVEKACPNPRFVSSDRKLAKVSWNRASEFIVEHGGSYNFGNTTCKRKWLELHSIR